MWHCADWTYSSLHSNYKVIFGILMGVGVTWNIKFTDNVAGIGSIEGNKKEVYLQYLG